MIITYPVENECPNRNAVCINIRDCPLMVEILKRPRPLSTADLATLRNSQCGWDGNDPKVCCGNQVNNSTRFYLKNIDFK